MLTNTVPQMDMSDNPQGYCPRFNPEGWDGRHLHFENKLFVHATTRSVMHVPVNMGRVFTRVQGHIEDAVVQDPCGYFVLSRDLSATKGEHLFAVTGPIPEEEMTTLTGDYVTRVFEGPYRKAKTGCTKWRSRSNHASTCPEMSSCSTPPALNARAPTAKTTWSVLLKCAKARLKSERKSNGEPRTRYFD